MQQNPSTSKGFHDPGESLSVAVCLSVAEAEGVDPVELDLPLSDVIDPDALDRLFLEESGQVSFEYHDYEVTVSGDGSVTLDPL